jgi:hypothetical protein
MLVTSPDVLTKYRSNLKNKADFDPISALVE